MKILTVSILGKPNAGKSSMINNILNYNISIISNKPQTTRDQIVGIFSDDYNTEQFIFLDTPGIHKSTNILGKKMNEYSFNSLNEIDLVLFLSPINLELEEIDEEIIEKIKNKNNRIAIITKIDLEKKYSKIDERAKQLLNYGFKNVLAFSIKKQDTKNLLLNELRKYSYEGEPLYDSDYYTDKSIIFITKELIRESALELLDQEIPHNLAVNIDEYIEKNETNKTKIKATIYVLKESHKGIVIGKNGSMIKKIGIKSRKKIEIILDEKIILETKVKVNKNWISNFKELKKLGY